MERREFINNLILTLHFHSYCQLGEWVDLNHVLCRSKITLNQPPHSSYDLLLINEDVDILSLQLDQLFHRFKYIIITHSLEQKRGVDLLNSIGKDVKLLTVDYEKGLSFVKLGENKRIIPAQWRVERWFEGNKKRWMNICSLEEFLIELRTKGKCLL